MSSDYARALLKHHQHGLIARRAQDLIEREWVKGCTPWIAPVPVELEPPYTAIAGGITVPESPCMPWTSAQVEDPADWSRMQVWISPDQPGDMRQRSERFLKQLSRAKHRIAMELLGNAYRVDQILMFHKSDESLVRAAFAGEFERCQLADARWLPHAMPSHLRSTILRFADFYPSPPYVRLLTRPDELRESVYGTIVSALATLESKAFGLVQVVLQPARPDHDWHDNVRRLIDIEHELRQVMAWQPTHVNAHQLPTGYTSNMAKDMNTKAHNDKPLFFAALRVAVGGIDENPDVAMEAISAFTGMIQHGGRPLSALTERHYLEVVSSDQLAGIVATAHAHRPAMLLNSEELTTMFQLCPPQATEFRRTPLRALETLMPSEELAKGVQIGVCEYAGSLIRVCLPLETRRKHTHLIGGPGSGKSTLLEYMALDEIAMGHGMAVLDPHGTLVRRLLKLIPAEHAHRVILLDPADPLYVPSWNPLHSGAEHDPGGVASDLVEAVHSIVDGWGERLAHLLRHAFFALAHVPGACFRDVADLLRKDAPASKDIIHLILSSPMNNDLARRFWAEDFPHYGRDDLRPPQHKLSSLLIGGTTVSLMLSQPESKINLRSIMDESKVLLVDLSGLGADVRNTLGCFMLSLLQIAAMGRLKGVTVDPAPFHIYCDEAHHFLTKSIDDLIAEARKYNVSLTLAHQFMSQFESRKVGALSSVAATIIFGVDERDAEYLKKDLLGRVTVNDLIAQGVGQAIARIKTDRQTEVVRLRTRKWQEAPQVNCMDEIIAQSRRLYCTPIPDVQKQIEERSKRAIRTRSQQPISSQDGPEYEYDEL